MGYRGEKRKERKKKSPKRERQTGKASQCRETCTIISTPMDLHQMSQNKVSQSALLRSPVQYTGISRENLRTPHKLTEFGSTGKALARLTREHDKESMSVLSMGHRIEVKDANAADIRRGGRNRNRRRR